MRKSRTGSVELTLSKNGQRDIVPPVGTNEFRFGFDIAEVTFERAGDGLRIASDSGAALNVSGFFSPDNGGRPSTFVLEDGTRVAAADFLKNFDIDIPTAAGPDATFSSGMAFLGDADISHVAGVAKLDTAATGGGAQREFRAPTVDETTLSTFSASSRSGSGGSSSGSGGSGSGGSGSGSSTTIPDYSARAVMYKTGSGRDTEDSRTITVDLLDADGNPVNGNDVVWKVASAASGSAKHINISASAVDPETGKLVLTLSSAGVKAIAEGGDGNLYSYVTITVNGAKYTMQVVINKSGYFDSAAEDANTDGGASLAAGGLVHGEWHSGREAGSSLDGADVTSSDKNDLLHFTGDVKGSDISSRGGDDTVIVEGLLENSTIDGGAGSNTISVGGIIADNGISAVYTEQGSISVANAERGIVAENGGIAVTYAKDADTRITVAGDDYGTAVWSEGGGRAGAQATGTGDVDVSVDVSENAVGLYAEGESVSRLGVNNGDITASVTSRDGRAWGMDANGGRNELEAAGQGSISLDVSASANAVGMYAAHEGVNKATTRDGDIALSVRSEEGSVWGLDADGGSNALSAEKQGNITLSFTGQQNASAMWAGADSSNTVKTQDGEILVQSTAVSGNAWGLNAGDGENALQATGQGDISVEVKADGEASGIRVEGAGGNTLKTAEGDILVSAESAEGPAWALENYGGSNSLVSEQGSVSVSAKGYQDSTGVVAEGSGAANTLGAAQGEVNVSAESVRGDAWALRAEGGGTNAVLGAAVSIDAASTDRWFSGDVAGLYAGGKNSANTVESSESVSVSASSGDGDAYAMQAVGGGVNSITGNAGSISLSASGGWGVAGMRASGSGSENSIEAENAAISMSVSGGYMTSQKAGMLAENGGKNSIANAASVVIESDGYGMTAKNGGENLLEGVSDVSITTSETSAYGMYSSRGSNTIKDADSVTISSAYGMNAATEGKNSIENAASVVVNAQAGSSSSYAMYGNGGSNEITGEGGTVSLTAESSYAQTMYADSGSYSGAGAGGNRIAAEGADVSVTAIGKSRSDGMYATRNGVNEIADAATVTVSATGTSDVNGMKAEQGVNRISGAGEVSVSATSNSAYSSTASAMLATGTEKGTLNSIENAGAVTLASAAANGNAYAMNARYGKNSISGETESVSLGAEGKTAAAMFVNYSKGENLIDTPGANVALSAKGADLAMGMRAESDGVNRITSAASVAVQAESGTDARGMSVKGAAYSASASKNSISADGAEVTVSASGAALATGMHADVNGLNEITGASKVDVLADGADAKGMSAAGNGYPYYSTETPVNRIDAAEAEVSVKAEGVNSATGMQANLAGRNEIMNAASVAVSATGADAKGMSVTGTNDQYSSPNTPGNSIRDSSEVSVTASGTTATGMHADTKGLNEIVNAASASVSATGESASGMYAVGGGQNAVRSAEGVISVNAVSSGSSYSQEATGMFAKSGGVNTVSSEGGEAAISAESARGNAYALRAEGGGANAVLGAAVSIDAATTDVYFGKNAAGLYASGGNNSVEASGSITVSASSTGESGYAMQAVDGGVNVLSGGAASIDLDASGWGGMGMHASGSGSENSIDVAGAAVSITATGTVKDTAGLYAKDGGKNSIENAASLAVNALNDSTMGYGLSAQNGGENTIRGVDEVTVTTTGGITSYGMHASKGANTISDADSVSVTASGSGRSASAAAMYANPGGENTIENAAQVQLQADSSSSSAYAMSANGGKNLITGEGESVSLFAEGRYAQAMYAYSSSYGSDDPTVNRIDVEGAAVSVGVKGQARTDAMYAGRNGVNEILDASSVSVSATGTSEVNGMKADSGGTNRIANADAATLAATGADDSFSKASAMYASGYDAGSLNSIENVDEVSLQASAGTAYAMNAVAGKNSVSGESGRVSLEADGKTAAAMFANSGKGENVINTPGADVTLNAAGSSLAAGMQAENDGHNRISGAADVEIRAESATDARGMSVKGSAYSASSSRNTIGADGAEVTVSASGEALVTGMYADVNGLNEITGAASVTVSATGADAKGMSAVGSSYSSAQTPKNSITDSDAVRVSASGTKATGMFADNGGENAVASLGGVSITASSEKGEATGMHAANGGSNTVTAGADGVVIDVDAATTAAGIMAYPDGVNTINSDGNILVDVDGGDSAKGIATYHGENLVSATHDGGHTASITVSADAKNSAQAVYSHDGVIGIEAHKGDITLNAAAAAAAGLEADGGSISVEGCCSTVSVTATGTSSATGLLAHEGGENNIATNRGAIDILAAASGSSSSTAASGMHAKADSVNTIHSNSGDISVTAQSAKATAYAMRAEGGDNSVSGSAGIALSAEGKSAYAMHASTGSNTVTGGDADVNATATGSASGMYASNTGANLIKDATSVTMDVKGTSTAYGMHADKGSASNAIEDAASVTINVTGSGSEPKVAGMYAYGYSGDKPSNAISADGDVSLNVSGTVTGWFPYGAGTTGMRAYNGANSIESKDGDIRLSVNGYAATGMYAETGGSTNSITAANGHAAVQVTGDASDAYGMRSGGGSNSVEAASVDVTVTTSKDYLTSTGMHVSGNGKNSITSDGHVNVAAVSKGSDATAMAVDYGENSITGGDVTLTANAKYDARGMEVDTWVGGTVKNSVTADNAATITAESASGVAEGMYAYSDGVNSVKAATAAVNVRSGASDATAMHAQSGGTNSIEAEGDVSLSSVTEVRSVGRYEYNNADGMVVSGGGTNSIDAANVTIAGTGNYANGMSGSGYGHTVAINAVTASGDVSVTGAAEHIARGMSAGQYIENSIRARGDVSLDASAGTAAYGMSTGSVYGVNRISADGKVIVSAAAAKAAGMRSDSSHDDKTYTGANIIENSGSVTLAVNGSDSASGMLAEKGSVFGGGKNIISNIKGLVSVVAESVKEAFGMNAQNGENSIEGAGSVAITATATGEDGQAAAMNAASGGGNSIAADTVTLAASGTSATGMAAGGGVNTIAASAKKGVSIDVDGLTEATGISTGYGGGNTVSAAKGGISVDVSASAGKATGVSTVHGANTLTANAAAGITITADGASAAIGIYAHDGANTLTAQNGGISVQVSSKGGTATGIESDGSENTLTATGNAGITVAASSAASDAVAMKAYDEGANLLDSKNGGITVSAAAFANATGLSAASGTNALNAQKTAGITVDVRGDAGATGLLVRGSEEGPSGGNSLTSKDGTIAVSAASTNGNATALDAAYGENVLTATGAGGILVTAEAGDYSAAMRAAEGGANRLTSRHGDITITATAAAHATGMESALGVNEAAATGDGDISLTVNGAESAMGIATGAGGQSGLTVKNGDIAVTITASEGTASGLHSDGGSASLKATGSGEITLAVQGADDVSGIWSADGGTNTVNAAKGDVSIAALSANGIATAVETNDGLNEISAGAKKDVTITAEGLVGAMGLCADEGVNRITAAGGAILVGAASAGPAWAVGNFNGLNEIGATASGTVTLRANGTMEAAGAVAMAAGAENLFTAVNGGVFVEAVSEEGAAKGLLTYGGTNTVSTGNIGTIDVAAHGADKAMALQAQDGGVNSLQSKTGSISLEASVSSENGTAYGMHADKGGENLITTNSGAVSVTITAAPGVLEQSWALFAQNGGVNSIVGNSTRNTVNEIEITGGMFAGKGGLNSISTGAGNDIITINGGMLAASAASAENAGRNLISTGKGDDIVTITGLVASQGSGEHSGVNIVDTGAGDDIIRLAVSGAIGVGSLVIRAGAGYDILTLVADSMEAFTEFYQDWLTDLLADKSHSLNEIHIEGVGIEDAVWLGTLCAEYGLQLTGDTPPVEDVMTAAAQAESFSLSGLIEEENGGVQDLFAEQGLNALAANGHVQDDDAGTLHEAPVFAQPEHLPGDLLFVEDSALFAEQAGLLEDMTATVSLDSLFAAVDAGPLHGAEEQAAMQADAALAAVDGHHALADIGQEEMAQLVQGAFIA